MLKYIIIVALGALSYGMLSSFAKIAYSQGYNAGELTFAQAFLGALILWIIAFCKKRSSFFSFNWQLLFAGTSMGISAYTYYLSVEYIPASLAIVLLMQMTWISILAEWAIFKKRPTFVELISCLAIIIGTILAGNLINLENFNFPLIGVVLGLASAILYTLYVLLTSKLGTTVPLFEKKRTNDYWLYSNDFYN